jgi:plastocyanin
LYRSRRPAAALTALALAIVGTLNGCGTSGKDRPSVEVTADMRDGKQLAEVSLHSFYFEPDRIVVKVGVPVELKLKKKSLFVPHNFHLHAAQAGLDVGVGVGTLGFLPGSKTVTFTPTRPGEYEFMCHKDNHAGKGMMGTLVVVP